jgi:hypothetical protein
MGGTWITLDITVCGYCEDVDQPAAGPKHVQCLRQGGGPHSIQDGINALSRPVANGLAYFVSLVANTVCAEASDVRYIAVAASRDHQQPSALRKLHSEAADTTGGPMYEHLLAWDHAALFRMEERLKGRQRGNGNSRRLREIQALRLGETFLTEARTNSA